MNIDKASLGLLFSEHPLLWVFPLHPFMFALVFGMIGTNERNKNKIIDELMVELSHQARLDSLTGLVNRRGLYEIFEREKQRQERDHHPFCIVLFDLDHFKKVNDVYGHAVGDQILKDTAKLLSEERRPYDGVCRWGGEEFLVLLAESDLIQALDYAERLRHKIEQNIFCFENHRVQVTISGGVTQCMKSEALDKALIRGDEALYKAKNLGRNQIQGV